MSRRFIVWLLHEFSADERGRVATFRVVLIVGAAVLATSVALSDTTTAAVVTVANRADHYFESQDLATRLRQVDECDCKIIEFIDVCGMGGPCCCRKE
jgi:hypothetical protein